MYINEECLRVVGVKTIEYINWCKLKNRKPTALESKREFFNLIREGRIYREKGTDRLLYRGNILNEE